jgi:hypothetical protein
VHLRPAGKGIKNRTRVLEQKETEATKRSDKTGLDLFWLKDKSLADLDNLPDPKDLAEDIVENIEAG